MTNEALFDRLKLHNPISFKLSGVTFRSNKGKNRQDIIATLKVGEPLVLVPEPDNPYDSTAYRVDTTEGLDIGYVPKKTEAWIAGQKIYRMNFNELLLEYLNNYGTLEAKVERIDGGRQNYSYGVTISVTG